MAIGNTVHSFKKYLYLSHRRDFWQAPSSLEVLILNFIHFFECFGLKEPPPYSKYQSLLLGGGGGSMDIFWKSKKVVFLVLIIYFMKCEFHLYDFYDFT